MAFGPPPPHEAVRMSASSLRFPASEGTGDLYSRCCRPSPHSMAVDCLNLLVLGRSQVGPRNTLGAGKALTLHAPRATWTRRKTEFSDFSSRPWRNLSPTWVIHMATRRPAHNTPIHMDFLYGFLYKDTKSMWIGVLWAGLRVALWIPMWGANFDMAC